MARPIDKDKLITSMAWHDQQGMISSIDDVLDIIEAFPTLTPPNEPLTCEGCACEEYSRDTYPCNCCSRNEETISDQYRPPEEKEDT